MSDTPQPASETAQQTQATNGQEPQRRGFLAGLFGGLLGVTAVSAPLAASFAFFLDPMLKKAKKAKDATDKPGQLLPVTNISNLPQDGTPKRFIVRADKVNSWNKTPNERIGAVYLNQSEDGGVRAFNAKCPHLGCVFEFKSKDEGYLCPCHHATFNLDGSRATEQSVSPRDLDALDVEVDEATGEIQVRFLDFQQATSEKIPIT